MNISRKVGSAAVLLVVVLFGMIFTGMVNGQDATPVPDPHWTYEGAEGPENWGTLSPNFAACSNGHAQSPIDITGAKSADLTNIVFNYKDSALNIFNNGHTIQVNYDAGSTITYNAVDYKLLQFHFHHPSEHTINGERFDMELHLVNQDANGNYAVVGVLLKQGDQDNPAFQDIFDNLPTDKGTPQPSPTLRVDANTLLPSDKLYFTYNGSLTTPRCTETVRWLVLTTPVEISAHQIEQFGTIFENDARPVQPLNGRDLFADNSP